jgi:hypothetical protein
VHIESGRATTGRERGGRSARRRIFRRPDPETLGQVVARLGLLPLQMLGERVGYPNADPAGENALFAIGERDALFFGDAENTAVKKPVLEDDLRDIESRVESTLPVPDSRKAVGRVRTEDVDEFVHEWRHVVD